MTNMKMSISPKGIRLIKEFESLHDGDPDTPGLQPKMDSVGIWTIGWGHAIIDTKTRKFLSGNKDRERAYELYPSITTEEAEELLKIDLRVAENLVNVKVNISLTQNEFDALTSHTYNTGGSNTLFGLVNNRPTNIDGNKPDTIIGYENWLNNLKEWFTTKYITAKGIKQNGLVRRRKSEYHLFLTGNLKFYFDE